jgi:hypothetical protein
MSEANSPEALSVLPTEVSPPQSAIPQVLQGVGGRRALLSVLRRRVMFVTRFIYYSLRHGTCRHAAWACHAEGIHW